MALSKPLSPSMGYQVPQLQVSAIRVLLSLELDELAMYPWLVLVVVCCSAKSPFLQACSSDSWLSWLVPPVLLSSFAVAICSNLHGGICLLTGALAGSGGLRLPFFSTAWFLAPNDLTASGFGLDAVAFPSVPLAFFTGGPFVPLTLGTSSPPSSASKVPWYVPGEAFFAKFGYLVFAYFAAGAVTFGVRSSHVLQSPPWSPRRASPTLPRGN